MAVRDVTLGQVFTRVLGRPKEMTIKRSSGRSEPVRWSEIYNVGQASQVRRPQEERRAGPPARNYYAVLGVQSTASQEQIEQRYRTLVAQLHPDHVFDRPTERDRRDRQLRELNEAVAILRDPVRRSEYDAQRRFSPLRARLLAAEDDR